MRQNRATLVPVQYQSERTLEEMLAFVTVVEARGFTAAARATRGRKATLSRRIQDLEARLGVPLLVRTTRSLRMTEEGSAYFEHAQRALGAAKDAEAVVASAKSKPRGRLRVSMASTIAADALDGFIATYLDKNKDVMLDLDTSERRVDLVREGFDLAVRVGPLEDSTLVARKLGVATGGFYASRAYLKKRGTPRTPDELPSHDTIAIVKATGTTEWPFLVGAKTTRIAIRPRMVITDLEIAVAAAARGLGIVKAPASVARPYLESRRLVAILEPFTPPGLDVHVVFPPGGGLVPKTRVFVDMLEAWFKGQGP